MAPIPLKQLEIAKNSASTRDVDKKTNHFHRFPGENCLIVPDSIDQEEKHKNRYPEKNDLVHTPSHPHAVLMEHAKNDCNQCHKALLLKQNWQYGHPHWCFY